MYSPELTWRDVQHIIVATAEKDGLIEANWQTNGADLRGICQQVIMVNLIQSSYLAYLVVLDS